MNLRQLETFRAVITAGTTNGAATLLGVSQPAVSRMIAHTEQSLGLRLFERNKGRLIPTEEAVQLHREIEPLFLAVAAAQSRIYDIRDGKVGSIRIVATPTLANTVMPRVLSELAKTTPEIRVSLDVRRWEQIASQIEANTADLGLALRARDRPTLVNKALHTGRFVCIMPIGHPLSKRDNVYAQDMLDYPFIRLNRSSPLGEWIASNLGDYDSLLKTVVETPYCNTTCALVNAGVGIALVDQFAISTNSFLGLTKRPFLPEIAVAAYAVTSKDRPLSRLAKRVIRQVEKVLREES